MPPGTGLAIYRFLQYHSDPTHSDNRDLCYHEYLVAILDPIQTVGLTLYSRVFSDNAVLFGLN